MHDAHTHAHTHTHTQVSKEPKASDTHHTHTHTQVSKEPTTSGGKGAGTAATTRPDQRQNPSRQLATDTGAERPQQQQQQQQQEQQAEEEEEGDQSRWMEDPDAMLLWQQVRSSPCTSPPLAGQTMPTSLNQPYHPSEFNHP